MRVLSRYVRRGAGDDSGYAMLVVVALASILALGALAMLYLSRQVVTDMERSVSTQTAFQAANAGVDRALARLAANPTTALGWPLVAEVGGASYSVGATLSPGATATTYTVTSSGTYRGVTQTVSQQFSQRVVPSFSLWDKYMFPNEGFNAVNGWSTTNIWGSVYTAGNIDIKDLGGLPPSVATRAFTNNVYVYNGQCYIKKGVDSSYAPVNLLANAAQTKQNPITGGKFATWSTDCPKITLPSFGLAELRSEWASATADGRVPWWAPYPMSLSAGSHPLTITSSTADTVYSIVDGVVRLKWQRTAGNGGKGLLTVNGLVYIDGNLTLPSCNYTGKGTLIVRGTVTVKSLLPKAGELVMNSAPEYTPLSQTENLGIVTPFDMTADPGPGSNSTKDFKGDFGMAGAFYVGGTVRFVSNNNRIKGAILASGCDADGHNLHLTVDPDMPDMLPPDMPGGDGIPQAITFQRLYNTWSRR